MGDFIYQPSADLAVLRQNEYTEVLPFLLMAFDILHANA